MIEQLRPADLAAWVNAAAPKKPMVLDVREPWEVQTASVKPDGFALLCIPMQSIPARLAELKALHELDQPIACLCHHGVRSQQVASYLMAQGFTGGQPAGRHRGLGLAGGRQHCSLLNPH